MSLEPAWGNCGETVWKSNMNGKKRGKKKRKTESTEQRAHKRETATSHSFTKRMFKLTKNRDITWVECERFKYTQVYA